MVKTIMSTDGSESEQTDSLAKTKDKLKVQQRLIDISARNLQSTRLSSRDFSGSGTVTPGSGVGEGQSAIEENIRLLENKLLKNFSNQLLLKHRCLKQLEDEEEYAAMPLEKVKSELDQLISLEQFLNVTGLEAKSTKALLSDSLTLDSLFLMAPADLEQMLVKYDINPDDGRRLMMCLDHLNSFYEMYQRGEKPSVTSYDRLGSTTSSRLGSMGSMDADYRHRTDSSSSTFLNSTTGAQSSSASTTPTPLTPSSSQSLLSPSPFTGGSASGTVTPTQIPTPPPGTNSHGFNSHHVSGSRGLNRGQSCSTTVLLSDVESPTRRQLSHSHHSTSSLGDPKVSGSGVKLRRSKQALTHKRSLSNPLQNIILNETNAESQAPSSGHNEYNHQNSNESYVSNNMSGGGSQYSVYQQHYQQQHLQYPLSHRSPSPPSRAGSQPSVYINSVGGSPSSMRHPQMRRIAATTPEFSVSIPNDEMMGPTPRSGGYSGHLSGSESVLHRQNTWQGADEYYPPTRCYSYAGQRKSDCTQPVYNEMTSASMVDLPMTAGYALSSEHLDQIEEYPLPSSGKSQSVPRLTLMSIDKGVPSTSAPTSPRTPGIYTPTGHMGHAIMHRFTVKTYKPHICDYCKKTVMMGVKCKHCKYRVHKACAEKAPHNCGLPRELIDYFRKQVVLTSALSPSAENFVSPSEGHSVRPPLQKVSTISEPDGGRDNEFVIQELSKEPSKTQFSPIMGIKRQVHENGRRRYELSSQTSSTSLLEVPHPHIRSGYRSTSSSPSPSTSPPTSPSLTPSSPRSPNEYAGGSGGHSYTHYQYPNHSSPTKEYIRVVFTDESGDESCDDHMTSGSSAFSSKNNSTNDISDLDRVRAVSPSGLRPPPQVIAAQSLPDLLNIGSTADHMDSGGKFVSSTISNGYVSDESYVLGSISGAGGSMPKIRRKESIQRTLSTADSKTSTLVNSLPTEEDDYDADSLLSSQGEVSESFKHGARVMHRNSIVDEWSIPYKNIKIIEKVGSGPVGEVYRGYWHGEVAIKRFSITDASPDQINRFKEEVAILKKTRHENLALFMGASLTAPDLAIVTSFCKGRTLYTYLHVWCEPFALEKSINIGRQVAQAMGYLHARGIVHKDLNTKNIFLEKDKVIITDTGLSSLSDNIWIHRPQVECEKGYVVIPRTKLYYLAPEILRVLCPCPEVADAGGDVYPYSERTDVFAFGTVMYELLTRKFPFMTDIFGFSMDPSVVVYLIGSGRRPDMQSREIPKRVKELVLQCWHQEPRQRLPFSTINEVLIKLSRKKTPISRSPSFPISLSRSSESLNFLK